MFTGLVEEVGALVRRESRAGGARLALKSSFRDLERGESIAIDGACLSVEAITTGGFEVDASSETLARTTLGGVRAGAGVNLERALKVGDRLGGHLVSGHVDGVGAVAKKKTVGESLEVGFSMPRELARFVAEKGSITVAGVSLTVNRVSGTTFDVMLIPITREKTTLGALDIGTKVNLEVDLVARYVARLVEERAR